MKFLHVIFLSFLASAASIVAVSGAIAEQIEYEPWMIKVIEQVGIPVGILLIILAFMARFGIKYLWPLFTQQIHDAREVQIKFLQMQDQFIETQKTMTEEIKKGFALMDRRMQELGNNGNEWNE